MKEPKYKVGDVVIVTRDVPGIFKQGEVLTISKNFPFNEGERWIETDFYHIEGNENFGIYEYQIRLLTKLDKALK